MTGVFEAIDLCVSYGSVVAVDGVSFAVSPGEVLGVVGESGSGKSSLVLAAMGLLPPSASVSGSVRLRGEELLGAPERRLEQVRGNDIAVVFQDALSSLNPVHTIGAQVAEAIEVHDGDASVEVLLDLVGLEAGHGLRYPHELSGGMRQRAAIAMALANDPAVLLADEPTTALDVTVQAQVLDVLERVRARTGTAVVLVTHDLGVVARMADRVLVLHQGTVAECAAAEEVFARPSHPYTASLLAAVPRVDAPVERAPIAAAPVLEVAGLVTHYRRRREVVHAVCGIDLEVRPGETVALVGESGSGKTTTVRSILRLTPATGGSVGFDGTDLLRVRGKTLRQLRRRMQVVFQDPVSSLNPRLTVGSAIADPMQVHGMPPRVDELLAQVGLDPALAARYPHELSGGQRQRVGIARALAVQPEVVLLDEPVSSLDVTVQAGILDLLEQLQRDLGVAYLLVSHDLAVVRRLAHRVEVMYLGTIVESGAAADVYAQPRHPYTEALLSAVPVPDPTIERSRRRIVLTGDVPRATDPPAGCRFHPRCWLRQELAAAGTDTAVCATTPPALVADDAGHAAACHFRPPPPLG